jgi:phosphoribosylamine--glycine ligase
VPLPATRDYKRAFDGDKGPNTGGMGSYKDADDALPFLTATERQRELALSTRIFEKWKTKIGDNSALRGVPLYLAFMHTGAGLKILENNSRPGDPEIINILPILKEDFVDICFRILEGNLAHVELEKAATVLTYKVPPGYGGYASVFPDLVNKSAVDTPVDLSKAYALTGKYSDRIRVYPAAMEVRDSQVYALKSRAVGVLGVGETIEEARQLSLEGAHSIKGGAMWNRTDIASKQHIAQSVSHMERLRRNP